MTLLNVIAPFAITCLALLILRPLAEKWGLIDLPGGRKQHTAPTPMIGGLAIFIGILPMVFLTPGAMERYHLLVVLSALVLFVGMVDDRNSLPSNARMAIHALAAVLMCLLADNQLHDLGYLLGKGLVGLGIFSIPLTVFATVGVINAANMCDGVDGLSGGMVGIALAFLGIMALQAGELILVNIITIMFCALMGFMLLNFRLPLKQPAMVYLGDAGSTFLGFALAWLLIEASQHPHDIMPPALALWFIAIPLMDTVRLLIKRPLQGHSPMSPGLDHLHHRLLSRGWSRIKVVLVLLGAGISLGGMGLLGFQMGVSESTLFYGFLVLFFCYFIALWWDEDSSNRADWH